MKTMIKKLLSVLVCLTLVFGIALPVTANGYTISLSNTSSSLKAGDTGTLIRNTNLRSTPSLRGKVLLTAKKGTSVTIKKAYVFWYQVSLSSGKTGYMIKRNIKLNTAAVTTPSSTGTSSTSSTATKWNVEKTMTLATTTSTQDTGLLDYLVPIFEKKFGVSVKVVSVGTGEAIAMGKSGDADVVLVHSRSQEDAFVTSGYGVNRKDVMHNEFFIVGPKDDPAKISGEADAAQAFKKIAESKSTFISRGDKSGTNTKELSIWKSAGITPAGQSWYLEASTGMGETLMMSSERGAYTLVDSGTWYAYMNKLNLSIVVKGSKALLNPYGVIAVSKEKYPNIHYNAAMAFADFITSPEGQKYIAGYVKNGHQLFYPDAK